jgi:hypothetical protein
MSNAVFINVVSMTHYTLELSGTFVSYGYKISDDQFATFCDVWETMDSFLLDIGITKPVTGNELAKALVRYIVKSGPEDARDTIIDCIAIKLSFSICDEWYDWSEVNEMLG